MTEYQSRLSDPSISRLIAEFGIYALWILKHGMLIPERISAVHIHNCYKQWAAVKNGGKDGSQEALLLFDAIDKFCLENEWEKPIQDYETALQDWLEQELRLEKIISRGLTQVLKSEIKCCADFKGDASNIINKLTEKENGKSC